MLTDDRPMSPPSDTRPPELPLHKGNKYMKRPPELKRPEDYTPSGSPMPSRSPVLTHGLNLSAADIADICGAGPGSLSAPPCAPPNPKDLMGRKKLPILSVIPMTALLREAEAMEYGAFRAPRADGGTGYRPFNWRNQPIEFMTYVDATLRHVMQAVDGEDIDPQSLALHLAHARASLGILIDALEQGSVIDNRPKRVATQPRLACDVTHILDAFKARKEQE